MSFVVNDRVSEKMKQALSNARDKEYVLPDFRLGETRKQFPDKICAILLALSPILQHYRGVAFDAGIDVLILIIPWLMLGVITSRRRFCVKHVKIVAVLIVFSMYKSIIHDVNLMNVAHALVIIFYYFVTAIGCINMKYFIKAAFYVSVAASLLIIVQYICHYIFGFHLQLVPTSLLLSESSQWILGAKTGLIGITGRASNIYRPSAFFLEPSHMFLYVFPHLLTMLFAPKINKRRKQIALLLSVGLVFTTSGMGIATVVGAWGLYLMTSGGKENSMRFWNVFRTNNTILVLSFFILMGILYATVPLFRQSVGRILDMSNGGAVAGRTRLSYDLLRTLRGSTFLFGVTNTLAGIEFNMPGFAATFYKFGIVGVVLSYSAYIYGLFKLKAHYRIISLLVIVVSFFSAQTHGTFYMMYYVFLLMEGNYDIGRSKEASHT